MHLSSPPERVYNFRIWSSQPNYQELIRIGGRLAKLSVLCSLCPEADLDDPSRVSNYEDDNPRNPPPRIACNLSLYSGRNEGKLDDHEKQRGILRRHLAEISVDGGWKREKGEWYGLRQWKMGFLSFGRWATPSRERATLADQSG